MNKVEIINEEKKVLKIEISSAKTLNSIFNNSFYNVVKTIFDTKGRIVVTGIGKSGHIANKISATFSSTGTPSQFVHPTEASHGDLGSITNNDCILVVSNSGQSYELNDVINYAKRFNIPLLSISSNKNGLLYNKSDHAILFRKPIEACPLNLAPTSSTTMTLMIGDAIAISLLKMRGFKKSHFSKFHPGGNLGKDLVRLSEVMHGVKELPLVKENDLMSKVLLIITKKSFGCVGVINKSKNLIGIITDGDLRRNINKNFLELTAKHVMTPKPKLIDASELMVNALKIMNKNKITCLFAIEKKSKNKPVGIIHIHDCLRFVS